MMRRCWMIGVAAVTGAVALARFNARWRTVTRTVAPELRTPALALPLPHVNRHNLALLRLLVSRGTVPLGVRHDVRTVTVSGRDPVVVHLYEPAVRAANSGALLWIHGGGFVMGSPAMGHEFCGRVARDLGVLVVSVDYRLAPEHPFPAPLDDCYTSLLWLARSAATLGVDPDRIAVGGESAGGGLAATLVHMAFDRGEPPIAFQLLVYPMLDDRTTLRSDAQHARYYLWDTHSNRFAWSSYLGHVPATEPPPPYAAAARRLDLRGMPPTWIGVGDIDLFLAEDVDYGERLRESGVEVELVIVAGMYHGADAYPDVRTSPTMERFTGAKVDALRTALVNPTSLRNEDRSTAGS
jgi:acetyl esterase/lipase